MIDNDNLLVCKPNPNLSQKKQDLTAEVLEIIDKNLPKELQLINTAYNIQDFYNLREYVHRLHGMCCYCRLLNLKEIVKNLELNIINRNLEKISSGIQELNLASNKLLKILVK